jgi:Calpain family cysteine protease
MNVGRLFRNNNDAPSHQSPKPKKKKVPNNKMKKEAVVSTKKHKPSSTDKKKTKTTTSKENAVTEKKSTEPKEQKDKRKTNRKEPEEPRKSDYPGGPEAFDNDNYDPSKWTCKEYRFDGKALSDHLGHMEEVRGKSIQQGIEHFQSHPELYIAMMYQTSMMNFVEAKQKYHLLHRRNTYLYRPQISADNRGWMTLLINEYEELPRFPNNELPEKNRDRYTDDFEFQGRKLHIPHSMNKPILPGRGMGIGDSPDLKLIGDIDPSDVIQGTVGDCWLLGAISAVSTCCWKFGCVVLCVMFYYWLL